MIDVQTHLFQHRFSEKTCRRRRNRKGTILVLAAMLTMVMLALLAFTIDIGYIMTVQSEMDRAVDAAALAGAGSLIDGVDAANLAAIDVLLRNPVGSQILLDDKNREAKLQAWLAQHEDKFETETGHWDPQTRAFAQTDHLPSAIKVYSSYEHPALFFARIFGVNSFEVKAEAIARYQPRDIVLVLDFSGSMNDDSELKSIDDRHKPGSREAILSNLLQIYQDLGSPEYGDLQFTPVYLSSNDNEQIKEQLGLVTVESSGKGRGHGGGGGGTQRVELPYPYPSGSWDDYINYVKSSNNSPAHAGYQKKYGFLTLINYWLEQKPGANQTPDLWMGSAQPVTAVKDAVGVFMEYIQEVDCDDHAALVIYNSSSGDALLEQSLTPNFEAVENTVNHRQAAHYDDYTNIGAGIRKGWEELDAHARIGAKKMLVLMTDGQANKPSNTTYARQYAIDQAANAAQRHYQIVTISLGENADQDLMAEIAEITGGVHYNIPGGSSVNDYEDDLLEVFQKIAADRPLLLVR